MFIKKAIQTWRNRLVTTVQLFLPILFTVLALLSADSIPSPEDEPPLVLDLSAFGATKIVYSTGLGIPSKLASIYSDGFQGMADSPQLVDTSTKTFDDILLKFASDIGIATFNNKYIIGCEFGVSADNNLNLTGFFNGEPYHGPPISLHYLMNTVLKYFAGTDYTIHTTNHPFPLNASDSAQRKQTSAIGIGFTIAFCVLFGMAFLTTSFIIYIIRERSIGSKHLQELSGVSVLAYWCATFIWDFINYIVTCLILLIVFAAFQTEAYVNDDRLGLVFLLFVAYGFSILPFMYLWHYLFKTPSTGMATVTMLSIVSGLATLLAVVILKIPSLDTANVADALEWLFLTFFPNFCLGEGLLNIYVNYEQIELCEEMVNYETLYEACIADLENYTSWEYPGIGKNLFFLLLQSIVYFSLVFFIDLNIFTQLFYRVNFSILSKSAVKSESCSVLPQTTEDSDVKQEWSRLNDTTMTRLMETDSLIIKNVSKHYNNFVAVDHLCFGITEQECFGLLGQNGAGKTTTFKMLTGAENITKGHIFLNGKSIKTEKKMVQQNLGYCPQFDGLIEQLTGRETLMMYGRLRGVKEQDLKQVVNEVIDVMMLRKHADKHVGAYSGGNKRKLSTAIALIGNPPFILLDEPTTGMDPAARRQLWNVLSQVRASGCTLLLTSHSMEECDALCTKIAIMVNGNFMCLGSPQHLKNKFGQGYTLIARLAISSNDGENDHMDSAAHLQQFLTFIKEKFPLSKIFDDHQGYVHFQIPDSHIPLAQVFGLMEQAKKDYNVEDYSVHQTTLEQIFLMFARKQVAPRQRTKSRCKSLHCCMCCC